MLFNIFGPRVYLNYSIRYTIVFMVIYLIIVGIGFYSGFNFKIRTGKIKSLLKPLKLFKICVSFLFLAYIIHIYNLHSSGKLNLNITEVGSNYLEFYQKYYSKKEEGVFTYEILFLVFTAIPKFIVLALGFMYFKRLDKIFKFLFISNVTMILISHTLSMGNQKSIGDIVIFGMIAFMLFASRISNQKRKSIFRKSLVIMIIFFVFLSFSQYTRFDKTNNITVENFNKVMEPFNQYNPNHLIFDLLGDKAGLAVSHFITGYLSSGYYGLSLCLQLPFEWTYGIGSSPGLTTIAEKVTGKDIYGKTYISRMEQKFNVPGKRLWHTIFPWLASDFTFIGVLILFGFISFIYGLTWKEILLCRNPVSLLMFSLLTILFIFVPANNQIFHGYDYISITIFVSIYWIIFHRKYNNLNSDFILKQKLHLTT